MREKYYYLRDVNSNIPTVTVCLMSEEGIPYVGRGIAICSDRDRPCKAEGRQIARKRAIKALKTGQTSMPIARLEADYILGWVDFLDLDKSMVNSKSQALNIECLSEMEKRIIGGRKNV